MSLLHRRTTSLVCKSHVRYYAPKPDVTTADPRRDIIRKALYPSNMRNKPSPTGTWRPDVGRALQYAIPSVQAHDTIERAWLLHQRHERKARDAERARKYECMRRAMDELERVDGRLFKEANKPEDPRARLPEEVTLAKTLSVSEKKALEARVRGLFPRELKAPADTPSRTGWNYNWKPFDRPL